MATIILYIESNRYINLLLLGVVLQMDNCKISIIMGVYNGERYLRKGIDSILNQSFKDFEFIICDDGSTDNTWNLLKEYEALDSRVHIIKNTQNMGLAYSLNRCIYISQCDILARQDADDFSYFNRLEEQYEFILQHKEYAIIGTCWDNIDENGKKWPSIVKEKPEIMDMIWDGSFMHPSWMMRKSMLEKVGYYSYNNYTKRDQDYHLVLKLYGAGMKICNMQKILYCYTNDTNTFKRTKDWNKVKGLMWIRYDGYKRNNLPIWCYLFVLKPLLKNLLPEFITQRYYLRKRK